MPRAGPTTLRRLGGCPWPDHREGGYLALARCSSINGRLLPQSVNGCPPTADPRVCWLRNRSSALTSGAHHVVSLTVAHLAVHGASSGRIGVAGRGECRDEAVGAGKGAACCIFAAEGAGPSPVLVSSPRDFMDRPGVGARLGPKERPADPRRTNRTNRGNRFGTSIPRIVRILRSTPGSEITRWARNGSGRPNAAGSARPTNRRLVPTAVGIKAGAGHSPGPHHEARSIYAKSAETGRSQLSTNFEYIA
jgi:hypothetical protein